MLDKIKLKEIKMNKKCLVCEEKDKEITLLKTRVKDILTGYSKDKKIYMVTIGVLIVIVILILAFGGREGIEKAINLIPFFTK
jgi:hypothetical protein